MLLLKLLVSRSNLFGFLCVLMCLCAHRETACKAVWCACLCLFKLSRVCSCRLFEPCVLSVHRKSYISPSDLTVSQFQWDVVVCELTSGIETNNSAILFSFLNLVHTDSDFFISSFHWRSAVLLIVVGVPVNWMS